MPPSGLVVRKRWRVVEDDPVSPTPTQDLGPSPSDGAASARLIPVEVAWAGPEVQRIFALEVPEGSTVSDAVAASGVLEAFPEIDWPATDVGIFGRLTRKDAVLRPHDRVELYRPLMADPKEVRRRRARATATQGRAEPSAGAPTDRLSDEGAAR